MTDTIRCSWAEGDPRMRDYHDLEWGVPEHDSRALWELLMLEAFQAGLSWRVILHKRKAFRHAFAGFDPHCVARFSDADADVERLVGNADIVRSRAKITATVGNAKAYLTMRDSGEHFADWAWMLAADAPNRDRDEPIPTQTAASLCLSRALKKRGFKFVGPVIVYAWMQAAGMVNDHEPGCFLCAH